MDISLHSLRNAVQHNCDIADANHARGYTMCTYLLKMREYYRWEKGYAFSASLPKDDLGMWLDQREQLWEELESSTFVPVPIGAQEYAPFDSDAINRALQPQGLVYSGGYGSHLTPHFFLGTLLHSERRGKLTVLVSGREYARDLTAPPAMMLGNTLHVRRESLRRLLWERIEEWQWRKQESAMARAVAHYRFEQDADAALERMTDNEIDAAILHELGEVRAGEILGEEWHALLPAVAGTRAEIMVRAVRDHLADCLSTLPALLESENAASLHFYFANLKGMRRALYPQLDEAYRHWIDSGRLDRLADETRRGANLWRETAAHLLELHRRHGPECRTHVEQALECLPQSRQAPEQPCACTPPSR
ncbi:MAG: Sfum_1244 family protein [Betaproteobacteria bacterium]